MSKKPVIFLTFANDQNGQFLEALRPEQAGLHHQLAKYQNKSEGLYHSAGSSEPDLLLADLNEFTDQLIIFHFSGHASRSGLQLESKDGDQIILHGTNLTTILAQEAKQNLKLVFLNACQTEELVEALHKIGVPAVIATSALILDELAKNFSIAFYRSLIAGNSLETAFQHSKAIIEPNGESERIYRGFSYSQQEYPWGLYVQNKEILNWKLSSEIEKQFIRKVDPYRNESSFLIDSYQTSFVGRDDIIREISLFTQRAEPGYMLIQAPAGFGKSALVANLILLAESGKWPNGPTPNILYFFIRKTEGDSKADRFFKVINNQLIDLLQPTYAVREELKLLEPLDKFYSLWKLVREITNEKKPLLLLVDGLDEMGNLEFDLPGILPSTFSPYCHIVATSRPNPEPLRHYPSHHPFKKAKIRGLDLLSLKDVEDILINYKLPETARLAKKVEQITNGEPLYTRFLCQDIVEKVKKGGQALEIIKGDLDKPKGVEQYFNDQLNAIEDTAGELVWKILGTLVVALGPLSQRSLTKILQEDIGKIKRALVPIQRYLLGKKELSIIHFELERFIANSDYLGKEILSELKDLLLAWARKELERLSLNKSTPADFPEYLLKFYRDHLEKEQKPPKDFMFLLSPAWSKAWEARDKTFGLLREDIRKTWNAFNLNQKNFPDESNQLICLQGQQKSALFISSIFNLVASLPPQLIELCVEYEELNIEEGIHLAYLHPDINDRVESLARLLRFLNADRQRKAYDDIMIQLEEVEEKRKTRCLFIMAEGLKHQADLLTAIFQTFISSRHFYPDLRKFIQKFHAFFSEELIEVCFQDAIKSNFTVKLIEPFADRLPENLLQEAIKQAKNLKTLPKLEALAILLRGCKGELKKQLSQEIRGLFKIIEIFSYKKSDDDLYDLSKAFKAVAPLLSEEEREKLILEFLEFIEKQTQTDSYHVSILINCIPAFFKEIHWDKALKLVEDGSLPERPYLIYFLSRKREWPAHQKTAEKVFYQYHNINPLSKYKLLAKMQRQRITPLLVQYLPQPKKELHYAEMLDTYGITKWFKEGLKDRFDLEDAWKRDARKKAGNNIPNSLIKKAIQSAEQIDSPTFRAHVYASLLPKLGQDKEAKQIVSREFALKRKIGDTHTRRHSIFWMTSFFKDDQKRNQVFQEVSQTISVETEIAKSNHVWPFKIYFDSIPIKLKDRHPISLLFASIHEVTSTITYDEINNGFTYFLKHRETLEELDKSHGFGKFVHALASSVPEQKMKELLRLMLDKLKTETGEALLRAMEGCFSKEEILKVLQDHQTGTEFLVPKELSYWDFDSELFYRSHYLDPTYQAHIIDIFLDRKGEPTPFRSDNVIFEEQLLAFLSGFGPYFSHAHLHKLLDIIRVEQEDSYHYSAELDLQVWKILAPYFVQDTNLVQKAIDIIDQHASWIRQIKVRTILAAQMDQANRLPLIEAAKEKAVKVEEDIAFIEAYTVLMQDLGLDKIKSVAPEVLAKSKNIVDIEVKLKVLDHFFSALSKVHVGKINQLLIDTYRTIVESYVGRNAPKASYLKPQSRSELLTQISKMAPIIGRFDQAFLHQTIESIEDASKIWQ